MVFICIILGIIVCLLPFVLNVPLGFILTIGPAFLMYFSGRIIDAGHPAGWVFFGIAIANLVIKFIFLKVWSSKSDKTSDSIYKKCQETGLLSIVSEENQEKLLAIAREFGVNDKQTAISSYYKGSRSNSFANLFLGFMVFDIVIVIIAVIFTGAVTGGSNSSYGHDDNTCPVCHRTFQDDSENAKSIRWNGMCTNCYENYKYASDALKERPVG